jgi:hypothetical protein
MWEDADAATVGLTRGLTRSAHAAPHTPAWATVVDVVLAMFWLGLALVSIRQSAGREGDDDHGSGRGAAVPDRQAWTAATRLAARWHRGRNRTGVRRIRFRTQGGDRMSAETASVHQSVA